MPNGNPGLEFFTSNLSGVTAQHDTGDTIFLGGTATSCADLTTCYDDAFNLLAGCDFVVETNYNVLNGIGQFAGATGTITVHTQGTYTAVTATGGFGLQSNHSEWSLELADNSGADNNGLCSLALLGLPCQ